MIDAAAVTGTLQLAIYINLLYSTSLVQPAPGANCLVVPVCHPGVSDVNGHRKKSKAKPTLPATE